MKYKSKYTGKQVDELLGKAGTALQQHQDISGKQDIIEDLESIRDGAKKGKTALQSVPQEYVTETELENKRYATKSYVDTELGNKVTKVNGKQLSTEDFTTALKDKLSSLSNYDDRILTDAVNSLRNDFNTLVKGDTTTAIKTFNEIIAFLEGVSDTENLEGIIAYIEQQIAAKQDIIRDLDAIRAGALKGATALQEIPEEYITESELEERLQNIRPGGGGGGVSEEVIEYLNEQIALKQDKLISGQNIKTINGESILGKGNIEITSGTGASYKATINLTTSRFSAVKSNSIGNYIEFTFDTTNESGESIGEGVTCTYTFTRGSSTITITQRYRYGESVRFNIDKYLKDGANDITINIVGNISKASTFTGVSFQVVNLELSDTFDISKVYDLDSESIVEIPFSVSGTGTKTVEWYVNGTKLEFDKNIDEVVSSSIDRVKYVNISQLPEGVNAIEFRAYSEWNGERFYSKTLHRDIIVTSSSSYSRTPVLALSYDKDTLESNGLTLEQYIAYDLKYAFYSPLNLTYTDVNVTIDNEDITLLKMRSGVVDVYPLIVSNEGDKVLKFSTEEIEYILPIHVSKVSINITKDDTELVLDFSAVGRTNNTDDKDFWSDNTYTGTITGVDFNSTSGWLNNKLLLPSGGAINFDYAPLANEATDTGKTIEFEFASSNVSNDDTILCDLQDTNGTGIMITASKASIRSSGGSEVSVRYKPEEQLRISFVINKTSGVTNKCLAFIYVNGIVSAAVNFADTDSFICEKELSIQATESAEILLKQIRIHNTALSSDQILNNYILFRDDSNDMISTYNKNNIYEEGTESLAIDKLQGQLPVMLVTGDIPTLENTTNKDTQITVDIEYYNLQDPSKSFTMKNAAMRPQGTSSMLYPKKNFRIYTQKLENTELYDSNGNIVEDKLYAFKDGSQPVNCWCLKADYAESSGTHNTGIARLWHEVLYNSTINGEYVFRTQAQKAAIENNYPYDVRTTIDGLPILMFYRTTVDDNPIFIGKYNFNNDKSTESVFGFKGIPGFNNTRMQCWEILNNGDALALFTNVSDFNKRWSEAFESRYPDTKTPNLSDLKAFSVWLNSMKNKPTTFATEKWEHFNIYMMAAYYVYLMRFGAVDQTVKNAMLTSEDGEHFYFINYDNDTINGLRNNGVLVFDPTIDRQSLDPETGGLAYAYAGHDSVLWNMLEGDEEFMQIVKEVDNALYTTGLSYDRVIKVFNDEQADMWNERIYNQDAQYKYIGPYTDSSVNNLKMLQGKRQSHRNWWLSKRFSLYDSKFVSGDFKGKALEFKVINNTEAGWTFGVEAGTDMEYGFGVYNPIETGIHLNKGETHNFTVTQTLNIGDPVRIYSAVNIQGVNLSNILPRLSNIELNNVYNNALGTKFKKLILGNGIDVNTTLSSISSIAKAKRLEELDIRGCKGITNIDLSNNQYLKKLRATNSGLTGFSIAEGAPLEVLELPSGVQALMLKNLPQLTDLYLENNGKNLRIIDITGCPTLTSSYTFFTSWLITKQNEDRYCTLNLDGINWEDITPDILQYFIDFKNNGGNLSLRGTISLTEANEKLAADIIEVFGENVFKPSNELFISAPDSIYLTGPTEIYEGESAKFNAVVFSSYEGILTYSISSGSREGTTIDSNTGLLTSKENGKFTAELTITARFVPTFGGNPVTVSSKISIIKRVYPTESTTVIIGDNNLENTYHKYYWKSSTADISGNMVAEWTLDGTITNNIEIDSFNNKECTLRVHTKTQNEVSGILSLTLKKVVNNSIVLTVTKNIAIIDDTIAVSANSNPEAMEILYKKGVCASPDYMTKGEAALVTNEQLAKLFNYSNTIKSFNEFKHFTSVTSINGAFSQCYFLTSITIPDSVTSIGNSAFYYCNSLTSITIPDNVTSIGNSAFSGCKSLTSIIIPEGVTSIGGGAFEECISLTSINIPKGITSIGGSIFKNCTSLTSITIPEGVISIDVDAFYNCSSLISITIPDNVTSIGNNAFNGCSLLTSITIPKNVTSIGKNVFSRTSLSEIKVDPKNTAYDSRDNCNAIIHSASNHLLSGCNSTIIPNSVTSIEESAFQGCSSLTSITIPNGVTSIEYATFNGCSALESISIPESVTSISRYAFYGCKSLTSINIPNSVTSIEEYTFNGCSSLTFISIPESATSIGNNAFNGCSLLSSINIPKDITIINKEVFKECSSLTSITIPEGVTSIEYGAFQGCSSLTFISIPESVTSIKQYTFNGCSSLTSINIPESVTSIGGSAFYKCTSLTSVNIPEGITTISNSTFSECSSLTSIIIPENVTSIEYGAFTKCTSLSSISVKRIEAPNVNNAFGSYYSDYTGINTRGSNVLYVPQGATGYDTGYWLDPLQQANKCGFTISYTL